MKNAGKKITRINIFLIVILSLMILLSAIALVEMIKRYSETGWIDLPSFILSVSVLSISIYIAFQARRKTLNLEFEPQKVFTIMKCTNCNFKITRNFQKGDFVLKKTGQCPICGSSTIIYGIFRKQTLKEKKGKDLI